MKVLIRWTMFTMDLVDIQGQAGIGHLSRMHGVGGGKWKHCSCWLFIFLFFFPYLSFQVYLFHPRLAPYWLYSHGLYSPLRLCLFLSSWLVSLFSTTHLAPFISTYICFHCRVRASSFHLLLSVSEGAISEMAWSWETTSFLSSCSARLLYWEGTSQERVTRGMVGKGIGVISDLHAQ